MAKRKDTTDYVRELENSFCIWERLKEYGGSDPFYSDGVNMNLVRNHISYYKAKIEETIPEGEYPEIYYKETPPIVSSDYMARNDEIRRNAQKTLALFECNDDLKLIRRKLVSMDEKFLKLIGAQSVSEFEQTLRCAIAEDDLVTMRRFEKSESRMESIKRCAEKIREYVPPKNSQITLFDLEYDSETEGFGLEM